MEFQWKLDGEYVFLNDVHLTWCIYKKPVFSILFGLDRKKEKKVVLLE